jgi:carbonic anhydrase
MVSWIVLKQTTTMSQAQYEAFREVMGNNFRPVQALNGRTVRKTP